MRALWTCCLIVVAASCASRAPAAPVKQQPLCIPIEVRVVDEAARPIAGARVRTTMTYRQFGPSALPEGSFMATEEIPVVTTDADGTATVCKLAVYREGTLEVEYLDWPHAKRPWHEREITIGRARAALVQVPASATCPDPKRIQVAAYAEPLVTSAIVGTQRPALSFTLANLGPWRYWVRSEACDQIVVRMLDGRDIPPVLTMDHNEAVVDHRAFAGGTATITVWRDPTPVATATLPADGVAAIPLPGSSGSAYCLTLKKDDRCLVTFARVGEVSRPGMYLERTDFLARDCPVCPAAQ